jgi:uncharacterized protein (DUF1697 family)
MVVIPYGLSFNYYLLYIMSVKVSFLRGVNMAGHCSMKMADLLTLYKKLGFKDAVTYIQSGNVVFTSDNDVEKTGSDIGEAILKKFDYNVAVMIRTAEEIQKINNLNPYLQLKDFDPAKSSVIFLLNEPDSNQLARVADINYPPDSFKIIGREIFIYCPNGFGRTKLYTNFFENKMKVTGTARNWKTLTAIQEIASLF